MGSANPSKAGPRKNPKGRLAEEEWAPRRDEIPIPPKSPIPEFLFFLFCRGGFGDRREWIDQEEDPGRASGLAIRIRYMPDRGARNGGGRSGGNRGDLNRMCPRYPKHLFFFCPGHPPPPAVFAHATSSLRQSGIHPSISGSRTFFPDWPAGARLLGRGGDERGPLKKSRNKKTFFGGEA